MERRTFLRTAVIGSSAAAFGGTLWRGAALADPAQPAAGPYGALQAADGNGILLPSGFTSRIIARSGQTVPGTSYTWHGAPDGGASFADGGGWIYVSNAEVSASSGGGASAVRFDSAGPSPRRTGSCPARTPTARAARPRGTPGCPARRSPAGFVYETDPWGGERGRAAPRDGPVQARGGGRRPRPRVRLPDRGRDRTAASTGSAPPPGATCPPARSRCWWRAPAPPARSPGRPSPTRTARPPRPATRSPARSVFNGGEGCFYAAGTCWFTTKGDNRVWAYDANASVPRAGLRRLARHRRRRPADRRRQRHRRRLR